MAHDSLPLTHERLKQVLHYDPETGIFTWLICMGKRAQVGAVAGTIKPDGYVNIKINGKLYKAARLAWFYMTGEWPKGEADHEDLCRGNNVWANLRDATHSQNQCNSSRYSSNTSGFKGVYPKKNKWVAAIQINKVRKNLGYFDTPEKAHAAYREAAQIHHKEFARFE